MGHAKVLCGWRTLGCGAAYARVVREDLSVRQLEQLVRVKPRVPRGTSKEVNPENREVEEELQRRLGKGR